jgi:hypothetical protein
MNRKWEILPQSQNKVDIRNQRTFLSKNNMLLLKLERLTKSPIFEVYRLLKFSILDMFQKLIKTR